MQAGEVIWLLAGIGIGLVAAMLILVGVLIVDGRRLAGRVSASQRTPDLLSEKATVVTTATRTAPPVAQLKRPREARPPLAPMPTPEPAGAVLAAQQRDVPLEKPSEPVAVVPDEVLSNLAAELARVQVVEPAKAVVEPPTEPVRPAVEATPPAPLLDPEPGVGTEVADALPEPASTPPISSPAEESPPALHPLPKVPPLPKVTPARKFAPALPPRTLPESGKS